MMVDFAREGKSVVRLKGGDPFLFGRGGEEAQACRAAGIDFEVVPGVTSAVAVPAYAGIPLTHREYNSSVTILTGQPGELHAALPYDWDVLAKTNGTLVFLMSVLKIEAIATKLREAGMSGDTPVAVVQWGATPRQRTLTSTLAEVGHGIDDAGIRPPAVVVIGEVAALSSEIAWYERLPLFGKRIVITRARHQAAEFGDLLERQGAEVVNYPTIEVLAAEEPESVVDAFDAAATYDWLVLTSVNGVRRFFDGFLSQGNDVRQLAGVKVAAIGPATAAAIEAYGIRVSTTPAEYRAESLLEALGDVGGARIMIARAEVAREVLPESLRERGAIVDVVTTYRSVVPHDAVGVETLGDIDLVTFTSSATVRNFVAMDPGNAQELLRKTEVASIGPVTSSTLREFGVEPVVEPPEYTIVALADSICGYFAKRKAVK
jgi:uroporphyrinogen III methyltransferase/synthase